MPEAEAQKIGVTQKAFILKKDGKVLIVRRSATAPSKPNCWDLPGGGIDFGEDPRESICREIKEETGLEVSDLEPFDVVSTINNLGEFWVTIAWRACTKSDKVQLSYEHDDFKWVDLDKIPKFTDSKRFAKFLETHSNQTARK
jgi:8-oxo-dGTP diphosphatase